MVGLCTVSTCPYRRGSYSSIPSTTVCLARCRVTETLHRYYSFSDFRPGQLEVILPVLHKKDVFARMATGAGKSLCMFLPPLAISPSAIGLVISPLVGLMEQQVSVLHVSC